MTTTEVKRVPFVWDQTWRCQHDHLMTDEAETLSCLWPLLPHYSTLPSVDMLVSNSTVGFGFGEEKIDENGARFVRKVDPVTNGIVYDATMQVSTLEGDPVWAWTVLDSRQQAHYFSLGPKTVERKLAHGLTVRVLLRGTYRSVEQVQ